jgi:hypothetical protein
MMVTIHLVAGWQRPRLAVIVSGILWLLYAVYEPWAATSCDGGCNIRVDLVFLFPILGSQPSAPTSRTWGDPAPGRSSSRFSALSAWLFSQWWRRSYGYGLLSIKSRSKTNLNKPAGRIRRAKPRTLKAASPQERAGRARVMLQSPERTPCSKQLLLPRSVSACWQPAQ